MSRYLLRMKILEIKNISGGHAPRTPLADPVLLQMLDPPLSVVGRMAERPLVILKFTRAKAPSTPGPIRERRHSERLDRRPTPWLAIRLVGRAQTAFQNQSPPMRENRTTPQGRDGSSRRTDEDSIICSRIPCQTETVYSYSQSI